MRTMPRDEGVTAETDPEPMRWSFDDATASWAAGWGLHQMSPSSKYVPYGSSTRAIENEVDLCLNLIRRQAARGFYPAQKALVILSAQKLCGQ